MTALPNRIPSTSDGDALLELLDTQAAFVFASPSRTLLARSPVAVLSDQEIPEICGMLQQLSSEGGSKACVVGMLPFAHDATPGGVGTNLLLVAKILGAGPRQHHSPHALFDAREGDRYRSEPALPWKVDREAEIAARSLYLSGVSVALRRMRYSPLQKVVLSRTLDLFPAPDATPLSPAVLAQAVRQALLCQPARYNYAVRLPQRTGVGGAGQPGWFLGASPELLLRKEGQAIESHPLAGSSPRSQERCVDERRGQALLASDKDRREHAFVVEAIADTLSPMCSQVSVPKQPSLVGTPTMWHLGTRIKAQLRDERSSLEVAQALHPTPAVCGFPTAEARSLITQLEPAQRGYFAGLVGWTDARGDGEWAVAIRCAELTSERLRLYAGAGIVEGSTPESELAETDAKLLTLLRALGLERESGFEDLYD